MADKPYIVECHKCGLAVNRKTPCKFLCSSCQEIGYNRTYYQNKKLALIRDNQKCQCCGTKKDLLAHHIDVHKSNNSLTNLIILCHQCHHHLHSTYTPAELRHACIYKLFPKIFRWGSFGKRFNSVIFENKSKIKKIRRFYKNNKQL
jgi:hypothetical protein